jgi:lipoprotein-anchoring transpeptidase ErfK/SrfK
MAEPAQGKPAGMRAKGLALVSGIMVASALTAATEPIYAHPAGIPSSGNSGGTSTLALADTAFGRPARMPSPVPDKVTAITPQDGASGVAADAALTVNYAAPISSSTPTPTLSPAVDGTWTRHGTEMTFVPAGGWAPYSTETVSVPAGAAAGFAQHSPSPTATTTTFTVQPASQARVEQFLAELNYLPFTLQSATPSGQPALDTEATTPSAVQTSPRPGTLTWSWATVPATLRALWAPGQPNVMDRGAVMAFEADHHLDMDGATGPQVWNALVAAVAARQVAGHPYYYLVASESLPETLTVYRDGQVVATSPANTGVPGATTETGTFPVYARYASQTMSGTNPDGTKYVDPGIPWVAYFNGGDAVHGFVRASYGHPQSNGCVELPVATAAQVWQMDPYGTLVTVTG